MVLQTSRLQFAGRISSPKHHNGDSVVDSTVESCISPGVEKARGHCLQRCSAVCAGCPGLWGWRGGVLAYFEAD